MSDSLVQAALDYHRYPTPGKISVTPTKDMTTQRDLGLAYSPGVAHACLAIRDEPLESFNLTVRGNLVAVISNGTAVLGLGNIGALASKPVMEGKGCLFKKFAGIDVFDIEVDATNGKAVLTNVSGSAVAHSLNGGVIATFVRVAPDKAMSFSSLNGDINVTLPSDTRARLKMKTDNGELHTDFDVQLERTAPRVTEEKEYGRHRIKQDHTTYGTINGGGPEMEFTSFNGNIYIRKAK